MVSNSSVKSLHGKSFSPSSIVPSPLGSPAVNEIDSRGFNGSDLLQVLIPIKASAVPLLLFYGTQICWEMGIIPLEPTHQMNYGPQGQNRPIEDCRLQTKEIRLLGMGPPQEIEAQARSVPRRYGK
jgi:hypothetical protein